MFLKHLAVFLICLAGLLRPVNLGAESAPGTVHLDDLISELVRSNPEVLAAEARYKAASIKPSIERTFPDPRLIFGWMSAGTILPGGAIGEDPNSNISIQIAQMIPYPGKRQLRSDIAERDAENLKWMQSLELNARVSALKAAYYELSSIYDLLELSNENKNLLNQLQNVAEARYSVGKSVQQDLIRASTELAILENRELSLLQRKLTLSAEINRLLNREIAAELGRPEKLPLPSLVPFGTLQGAALQNSPLLKAQQASVDSQKLQIDLTKKEVYPDIDLMSGYYYMGELEDMWEVKAEVSLPIFSRSKQKKETARASLELAEAQQVHKSIERTLEVRLREAYLKAETAKKLLELYSNRIIPQSRLALESSLASYEAGSLDFFGVLANFTTILQYRMNMYEQESEYLKAIASLEELIGTNISSNEVRP
jgi:outer membrane protein TolC